MTLAATIGFTQLGLVSGGAPVWVCVVAGIVVVIANLLPEIDGRLIARREKAAAELRFAAEAAAAEQRWLGQIHSSLLFWPLPPNDTTDAVDLGVRPSLAGAGSQAGSKTYVPRDVDAAAALRLREKGVLLLVGEPGSGLTRTATQLLHTTWPTRKVLAPRAPTGLKDSLDQLHVLERLEPTTRLLVWLDQINNHHGPITSLLTRCREATSSQRVIATIGSTHYERWATEQPELAAHLGEPLRVKRLPSPHELDAANTAYPARDFTYGIGASFTGTASLLARYTGGNTTCPHEPPGTDCTLTRTLIDIAIAWRATGTPQPLTTTHATTLATAKVPGLDDNPEAHTDACLTWACQPVTEGIALLTSTNNDTDEEGAATVAAHPELADILAAQTEPDTGIWLAALHAAADASNSEAIGRIGYTAHTKNLNTIAHQAWEKILVLDEPAVTWLRKAANYGDTRHDTRANIAPLEKLLTLTEQEYGTDHLDSFLILNNLGNAWNNAGEPGQAFGLLERALTIIEREYGPDHSKITTTLNNLGNTWRALGDPGQARDVYERALIIEEREYGSHHPKVAGTLNNLGGAWAELGQAGKALPLLERALIIEEREYGSHHPRVATTLNNVGSAWAVLGEPGKALPLLEQALTIEERGYGSHHPQVATTLNNLGNVLAEMGEPAEAVPLFKRALTIKEREYGPHHPEVAVTLNNLGNAWRDLDDPGQARHLHLRALSIGERIYGPDHSEIANTLQNLGLDWRALGEPDTARDLYIRALRIQQHHYPNGHPTTTTIRRNLRRVAPDLIILNNGTILTEQPPETDPAAGQTEGE